MIQVIEKAQKHDAMPLVQIRLPSALMFFLFCIIGKNKNTLRVVTKKNSRKGANERTSEFDCSIVISK
jgi:hypothetical protein